jgi:hypothetical protein
MNKEKILKKIEQWEKDKKEWEETKKEINKNKLMCARKIKNLSHYILIYKNKLKEK